MKKLFYFAVVVSTVCLVMSGCKKDDKKTDPKPEEKKETFVPENNFDILFNGKEAKMYLKGQEIHDGDTIVADEFDEFTVAVGFDGYINISTLASSALSIQIKEHRNYDMTQYEPSMCFDSCLPSNGKVDQTWDAGTVEPGDNVKFSSHVGIAEEVMGTPVNLLTDFEVTDGSCSVKFVVKYVYTPQE